MVETSEKFETVVEIALGERLQWLVCDDDDDVLSAVNHLKETSGGRCSFVSAKKLPGATARDRVVEAVLST